jgi:hypothetical protein
MKNRLAVLRATAGSFASASAFHGWQFCQCGPLAGWHFRQSAKATKGGKDEPWRGLSRDSSETIVSALDCKTASPMYSARDRGFLAGLSPVVLSGFKGIFQKRPFAKWEGSACL